MENTHREHDHAFRPRTNLALVAVEAPAADRFIRCGIHLFRAKMVVMNLDRIDCDIIDLLQNNARLSNKELAASVGLAPSSCLARIQRLRAEGVLKGARTEVDAEALGVGLQALIAVQLRHHSRPQVKAFWKHVLGLPEVLAVFHVAGNHDFQVHVAVRDAHHLRDLALDAFTTRPEVAHIQTSLIFEWAKGGVMPNYRRS
jgi:DNA-binding Lrp family transcriptional regulator